jgi:F-type H+-transporting ATPase subunit b
MAAEAAHPAFNWKKEALRYVNFLVVVGVLWWLLKDRLPRFFAERRRKIEESLGEAKAIKADAEAKRAEYGGKIARVEQEIAAIDTERDRRIEAMRVELTQAAEATAERVAHDAEERIAAELDQARAGLQREASMLALEIAEELIKKRVKKKHHRKLFEETVEKLEGIK